MTNDKYQGSVAPCLVLWLLLYFKFTAEFSFNEF